MYCLNVCVMLVKKIMYCIGKYDMYDVFSCFIGV